ncbi:hypothetical protein QCQ60_005303 [Bacillus cereus]|nr:hypothetical protein [Bacillus cereus]
MIIPYTLFAIIAITGSIWLGMFAHLTYIAFKETKEMKYRISQWLEERV